MKSEAPNNRHLQHGYALLKESSDRLQAICREIEKQKLNAKDVWVTKPKDQS